MRSSALVPLLSCEYTLPGMTKRSLPCSTAVFAVMSEPLFSAASGRSTPRQSPLIILLRSGNLYGIGWVQGAYSDKINPPLVSTAL